MDEKETLAGPVVQLSNEANIGESTVSDLLSRLYGLQLVSKKEHRSWADQIYHMTVALETANDHIQEVSENGYLLKIINTDDSKKPDVYGAHDELLSQLERQGTPVMRLVPTTDGRRISMQKLVRKDTTDIEGEFVVLLFGYCPGVPLSEVDCWRDLLPEFGAKLGKLHTALQGYRDPRMDSHGSWNHLTESPDERVNDALKCCYHDDQRAIVHEIEALYKEKLTPLLPFLRKGTMHGDYRMDNVIADRTGSDGESTGNSGYRIAAIIDFNDASLGHYVFDVGISVADVIRCCDEDEMLELSRCILQEYCKEFPLTDAEQDVLYLCVCLRILGHATADEDTDWFREFVKRSWDVLRCLLRVGSARFKNVVCNPERSSV